MLAVMGKVLEPRLGQPRFFLVFAVGAIAGAFTHALIGGSYDAPLVGASAGVGALYGAGMVLRGRGVPLGPNSQILAALTAAVAGAVLLAADPIGGSTQESVLNITAAVAGLSTAMLAVATLIFMQVKNLWQYAPGWVRFAAWALIAVAATLPIIRSITN